MKISQLLLYIGVAVIAVWILGMVIRLAGAIFEVALVVGLILVVAALISQYYERGGLKKK